MTAGKINCSIKCLLDGTGRATLRGLLEDYKRVKNSSARRQDSTEQGHYWNTEGGFVYGTVHCKRQILLTERIPQEELLRRTQEPKYRREKKNLSFM
jgi:hypothetical protein